MTTPLTPPSGLDLNTPIGRAWCRVADRPYGTSRAASAVHFATHIHAHRTDRLPLIVHHGHSPYLSDR